MSLTTKERVSVKADLRYRLFYLDNLHAKEEKKESTIVPIKAMMLEDIEKNTTNTSLQVLKPLRQGIWHWCFLPAAKEPALVLMVLRGP